MDLSERILKYIENHHPISYTKIVQVAAGKNFCETEVITALDKIGKKLKQTVKKNEIWYDLLPTPTVPQTPKHISWLGLNYPYPGKNGIPEFKMPFPEIDYSFIFMNREETLVYKAQAKGMSVHMVKKYQR